ncbi:protein kinase [Acinetobacter sp. HR7]|uniref:protein kinase domain-containing protein n=1 Tax=Acinetobacter sp. HR7 TaxID=1509403 RepID=UPI000536D749|nr:protein kinase [Acinetobacter sp. HR7]KGT47945.1 hypothetical protein GW12_10170 [Acinetobacter sp. HR7]
MTSEELQQIQFELQTKARSLAFGRRLYRGGLGKQYYWLKVQQSEAALHSKLGFENEWNFYQSFLNHPEADFLIPYQLIDHQITVAGEQYQQGILLLNCPAHFAVSPQELSLKQIQVHLLASLDAVMHLYQCGYLHADLKAEHFVQHEGRVRLIDFEQVRRFSNVPAQSLEATPRYMAPELFHGEEKTVQTEIYALGIIWLEWLTQTRLRVGSYKDWAYLHCQRLQIQLPTQFLLFQPVLEGMLAKHKSHRFTDFEQIRSILFTVID